MGPKPIKEGSTPTEAQETIFARGSIDFFSASSLDVRNKAAAPSLIPEEFPGVTVPLSLKTVVNFSKSDIFKPILGCSSFFKIPFLRFILIISSSNLSLIIASSVFFCELKAYWSCSTLVISNFLEIFSAVTPIW